MRILYLFMSCYIFLLSGSFVFAQEESFTLEEPKGWERIDDPTQLPAKVKMLLVGNGKWQFTPSINIAIEESVLSKEGYVEEAKSYHEKIAKTKVTKLGSIQTKAGAAELLQIDRRTSWGDIRFIQALIIVNKQAYVITATCLQEEFGQLSRSIFQTIQSFCLKEEKTIE